MNLLDVVRDVRRHLDGRLSLRMLRRQFALDDDALEEVIEASATSMRASPSRAIVAALDESRPLDFGLQPASGAG